MQSTFFDQQLFRLKEALTAHEDQEVAVALGMTKAAFSARKKRGVFPEKELYALAAKRPELGLDVDYVLTGITAASRGLNDAARARVERASDAGLGFEGLYAYAKSQSHGTGSARVKQLAAMLPKLRAVEFEGIFQTVKAIVELREALEKAARGGQ